MERRNRAIMEYKFPRIVSQTRNVINNVHGYFQRQWGGQSALEVEEKTSEATGVSVRSVRTIKQQATRCLPLPISSPSQRQTQPTISATLDDFDRELLRKEIMAFYERGELPTLDSLLIKVKQSPLNFKGGRSTLWKIVRECGFRYRKVTSGRMALMERQDIVVSRNKYLRLIEKNRKSVSPRHEVYIDETWINQRESVDKCWTVGDGSVGPKIKSGKGARFIVLHAGGTDGFIPNALLMFRSKNGDKSDYHDSMNNECFKNWFVNQLLPNIDRKSLIIMDNASYHSRILNKVPTSCNRKSDIIHWLSQNNIEHDQSLTKNELLEICKENRGKERYEIDEIAFFHGHEILRLPPYHCQFNPIELIWAKVKTEVKKENSNENQTVKKVEELTKNAIEKVTASDWKKCIDHTIQIEEEYRKKDVAREHLIEKFIVNIESDDSSSEELVEIYIDDVDELLD